MDNKELLEHYHEFMKELETISQRMEDIGEQMRKEEEVFAAELADRQAKGLKDDAAIEHYNQWMIDAGMPHLVVSEK